MKTPLFTILAIFSMGLSLSAQTLQLTQQQLPDDFKVVNGPYVLFFHKKDLVDAIREIDLKMKTDNTKLIGSIDSKKIVMVDLKKETAADKQLTELLKSGLGCLMFLHKKVVVLKGKSSIEKVEMDESPPEHDLDGSIKSSIFFSEKGSTVPIFLGRFDEKLR